MWFTNPLAELLPDDTEVEAMDNSHQGIFTIGDIKEKIRKGINDPLFVY
jgi:thioredoxin reductase